MLTELSLKIMKLWYFKLLVLSWEMKHQYFLKAEILWVCYGESIWYVWHTRSIKNFLEVLTFSFDYYVTDRASCP